VLCNPCNHQVSYHTLKSVPPRGNHQGTLKSPAPALLQLRKGDRLRLKLNWTSLGCYSAWGVPVEDVFDLSLGFWGRVPGGEGGGVVFGGWEGGTYRYGGFYCVGVADSHWKDTLCR